MDEDFGRSSFGVQENITAIASYFCVLGPVVFLLEKRSHFARFHAVQSMLGFALIGLFWLVTQFVGALNWLSQAPSLLSIVFVLHMSLKAYYGEEHKLPIIGSLAFGAIYETREDLLADVDETRETAG